MGGGDGEVGTLIFSVSDHFFFWGGGGVQNLNFYIFGGFQKNNISVVMKILLIFFRVIT